MIFKKYILLALLFIHSTAFAQIKVVTSTTDLKWLVEQIGGKNVKVTSLLNGSEDPHFIDAMPHFVSRVAKADMFCLMGLELEVGWIPRVLQRSGNVNVQMGGKGYCEAGRTVKAINIPKGRVDRSQGDIHPLGNPHYQLGPKAFLQAGETVLNTLINVDTKNAELYLNNYERLKSRTKKVITRIQSILKPVKNKKFIEYHREFTYFFTEFGLNSIGAIEKVPGVPPSAGRLARVSIQARQTNVALALASLTSPKHLTDKFSELSKVPVARLPISILTERTPKDYYELLVFIAKSIVKQAK